MKQMSLLEFQRLDDPSPADVVATADAVIDELGLKPPIDTDIVASFLGVPNVERTELDVAGCLVCDGGDYTIKVRASDGAARQRFTIFHECGHTFFQGFELQPRYRCAPSTMQQQDDDLEAMCDKAASSLLLPKKRLKGDLLEADFGMTTLMDVAETYQASLEATGYRIVDLAPYPTLFIVFEVGLKPSQHGDPLAEPALRVRAGRSRGDWPFIPRHKSVSTDSPLGRALLGEVVHERTILDELTREPIPDVEVSARIAPYNDKIRVLALYRRIPRRMAST